LPLTRITLIQTFGGPGTFSCHGHWENIREEGKRAEALRPEGCSNVKKRYFFNGKLKKYATLVSGQQIIERKDSGKQKYFIKNRLEVCV
jgi:hypothetical protein